MLQAEPLRDRDKGACACGSGCGGGGGGAWGGEDGSRQDVEFVYVEKEDKDEAKRLAFSCWGAWYRLWG